MFAKNKVSQSMLDAVSSVLDEKLDEASLKIPTSTGTKVLGRGYGNSAKAHEVQHKNPFEKGPSKSQLKGIKAPTKKELKNIGEEEVQEELKGGQKKIDANHNGKIDGQDFAILGAKKKVKTEGMDFANKLISTIAERDEGKPGLMFKKIASKAAKEYGSKEAGNRVAGAIRKKVLAKEDISEEQLDEMINEVLSKNASAGEWIHDFVHSDNPKFAGKSKAERKKMALGAYYGAQKEETELDEGDAQYKKTTPTKPMSDVVDRKKTVKDLMKGRQYFGTGKVKEGVEQIDEIDLHTLHTIASLGAAAYATKNAYDIHKDYKKRLEKNKEFAKKFPNSKNFKFDKKGRPVDEEVEELDENAMHGTVYLHKYHEGPSEDSYGEVGKGHTQHAHYVYHKKHGEKPKLLGDVEHNVNNKTKKTVHAVARTDDMEQDHASHMNAIRHIMDLHGVHASAPIRHIKDKKQMSEAVEIAPDKSAEKITTDTLAGRLAGGKLNSFRNFKVNLTTSGEESIPKEIEQGEDTKEKQKISTNPGPVDIKLDDKLTGPTPYTHFAKKENITTEEVRGELKKIRSKEAQERNKEVGEFNKKVTQKEEVEVLDEDRWLMRYLLSKGINPKFINRNQKVSHAKSDEFHKWKRDHQTIQGEEVEVPFDKPYKTVKEPTVKDKSGAVHTPMSRARDLAKQALKKVKNETMMGKAGATSESKNK